MILQAPAKINLVLRVIKKRSDGYHELETWMQKIPLFDTVSFRIIDKPGIQLICTSEDIPADKNNLLWKAAELFFSNSSRAKGKGVIVSLEKRIPIAAGLGGGSSDAGTLLKGINSYFDNEFDEETLIKMGKSLGADVPFFVTEMESVFATGIGEKMRAVPPLRDCTFLLVNPGISVSTSMIFAKFALTIKEKNSTLTGSRKLRTENLDISDLENDLEAVTTGEYPVISEIKDDMRRLGAANVLMSGSGPTVFGVFEGTPAHRATKIDKAFNRLHQKFGDKVYIVQSRVGV